MRQATVGDALEREHREIDQGLRHFAEGVERGEWRSADLAGAAGALRRHIYVEETRLFPPLREAGFFGPVAVMLREHGEIWQALDEVEAGGAEHDGSSSALVAYERLAALLHEHNRKEEAILYPAAGNVLDAEVDNELRSFLRAGVLPDAWVCESRRG